MSSAAASAAEDGVKEKEKSASSSIVVAVRVRPLNEREPVSLYRRVVVPVDDQVLVFDPATKGMSDRQKKAGYAFESKRALDSKFAFDHVFGEGASQTEIYEKTTKRVVLSVLDGYNGSVFAYGATGSGKTHTMIGVESDPGVMVRTMHDIFEAMSGIEAARRPKVTMSYMEVYNETIRDLLFDRDGPSSLQLREDPEKGAVVQGLSIFKMDTANDVFSLLDKGNQKRTQSPTEANAQSSRSHAVLDIRIELKDEVTAGENISASYIKGKLLLVDLAGSERASTTMNQGGTLIEGANINRSLLALGNCINALARSKENTHIPFRDSKLTRLLKDSLGGNCKTVMIAAVSPSSLSFEDTHNTLKYAARASKIKTKAIKNTVTADVHMSQYNAIISDLTSEIQNLKKELSTRQGTAADGTDLELSRLKSELSLAQGRLHAREEQLREFLDDAARIMGILEEQQKVLLEHGLMKEEWHGAVPSLKQVVEKSLAEPISPFPIRGKQEKRPRTAGPRLSNIGAAVQKTPMKRQESEIVGGTEPKRPPPSRETLPSPLAPPSRLTRSASMDSIEDLPSSPKKLARVKREGGKGGGAGEGERARPSLGGASRLAKKQAKRSVSGIPTVASRPSTSREKREKKEEQPARPSTAESSTSTPRTGKRRVSLRGEGESQSTREKARRPSIPISARSSQTKTVTVNLRPKTAPSSAKVSSRRQVPPLQPTPASGSVDAGSSTNSNGVPSLSSRSSIRASTGSLPRSKSDDLQSDGDEGASMSAKSGRKCDDGRVVPSSDDLNAQFAALQSKLGLLKPATSPLPPPSPVSYPLSSEEEEIEAGDSDDSGTVVREL